MKTREMRKPHIVCLVSLLALIAMLMISRPLTGAWASGSKAGTKRQVQDNSSDNSTPQVGTGQAMAGEVENVGSSTLSTPTGNLVPGALIGTSAAGTAALGNGASQGGAET